MVFVADIAAITELCILEPDQGVVHTDQMITAFVMSVDRAGAAAPFDDAAPSSGRVDRNPHSSTDFREIPRSRTFFLSLVQTSLAVPSIGTQMR